MILILADLGSRFLKFAFVFRLTPLLLLIYSTDGIKQTEHNNPHPNLHLLHKYIINNIHLPTNLALRW